MIFFWFFSVSFGFMLRSLTTTLIENLKMASQNENKEVLQRRWTNVYYKGDHDNRCCKEKGTKRK